jgi:class 3 adenylate cyclase
MLNIPLFQAKCQSVQQRPSTNPAILDAIAAWVLKTEYVYRARINPYDIAVATGLPLKQIISELLHAVLVGLFDLHWDVHCPHCNMRSAEYADLCEAKATAHCPMCDIDFNADFSERVTVTFTLNQEIEPIGTRAPCPPVPALNPRFGMGIPYQQTSNAEGVLTPGRYRYCCPLTLSRGTITVTGPEAQDLQVLKITQLAGPYYDPASLDVRPGPVRFEVTNVGHPFSAFWIAAEELPLLTRDQIPPRLSGLELIHHPDFRRLFGRQVLSEREELQIAAVTILFTDVTGSTQMYERLGDVVAYNIVRDHFEILFAQIINHDGTVLKTIGDAVMASFTANAQALQCVIDAFASFDRYNQFRRDEEHLYIRMSLHRGPAILVNLNERLDYFGSAINKAANLQSYSHSGEVALSEEICQDSTCQAIFVKDGLTPIPHTADLKSLHGGQTIYTLTLAAPFHTAISAPDTA